MKFPMTPERLVENLNEAVFILKERFPGIVFFDLDYTLKSDYLKTLLTFKFGQIPSGSIESLTELQSDGWLIGVITNQPRNGHQIAKILGKVRNYPYFPGTVEDLIGKEAVFGGDSFFFLPKNHYKETNRALADVCRFISDNYIKASRGIYVVGDRQSDKMFAQKIGAEFFIKLPDPNYTKIIPNKLKNLIP